MTTTDNARIIKLTLEYDGTNYAGWQRQTSDRSVQQTIEDGLERYLGEQIRITASGRTDAGVHAMGQVISFPTVSTIPIQALGLGLRPYLPDDLAIIAAEDAEPGFDARRSARMRWYRFFLCNRRNRPAVGRRYLTHVTHPMDLDKMRAAADVMVGSHDFSAFRSSACTAPRTRLTMQPIIITALPNDIVQIDYRCRSFLQNMVRIMTGALIAVGTGRMDEADIAAMLETGQRHRRAVTAKPYGLFLYQVSYRDDGSF